MSMTDEDRQLLGELKTHAEYTKEGISEIKDVVKELAENTRSNFKELYNKDEKTNDRVDGVESDFKSHKAKIAGFTGAVGALWVLILDWLKG